MTAEIIDQASALEEMMRENAIKAHRINHSAVSAIFCEECDEWNQRAVESKGANHE